MYFHTDAPSTIFWLMNVLRECDEQGRSIRLDVDSEGNLRVKVGEGMWTAPIASTVDLYRDCCFNRCNGDKQHDTGCVNA